VAVRPEFGYTTLKQRQQWRQSSVAGTAVSVHGIVAVFAEIYPSTDFSPLSKLKATVPLLDSSGEPLRDGGNQPRSVDFFSIDNPLWLNEGILVYAKNGLTARTSFQGRRVMGTILRGQIGM